jgi:hypothetical protein
MTAFEVAKRHEEKLMLLGPVIERQQSESLDMIIDRTFNVMADMRLLPPIPKELQGSPIKVTYTSLLAQAQKMVATAPIEQLVGFVGQASQAKLAADQAGIQKLDFDEAIDQYSAALGVAPKVVRSDDVVAEIQAGKKKDAHVKVSLSCASCCASQDFGVMD